jgi:GT2 family glycosyltransferase
MATVICPYVFPEEIVALQNRLWNLECIFEQDTAKIGSDMMYQKLWKQTDDDIIILHSDMQPLDTDLNNDWYEELIKYANKYPEAGMIGCKLLYPAKNENGKFLVQHAGGKINEDGTADHFGSGFRMEDQKFFKEPDLDNGQYDKVREVAWCTFGGVYIRRKVLDTVGDFDPLFEYTYERDVDYCLETRKAGWKIYMTPATLVHWESKDNKRVMTPNLYDAQARNKQRLKEKWKDSELFKTVDLEVKD